MWTKNGEATLPKVLNRIEQVIPACVVNWKVAVDDGSADKTVEWLTAYGWNVIENKHGGIGNGANLALAQVESDFFASFEQDLYLSRQWWSLMKDVYGGYAVTSGVRVVSQPFSLVALQLFLQHRYLNGERGVLSVKDSFAFGKTLDNTIYNTEVMRKVGGFPEAKGAGVDTQLAHTLRKWGLTWKVLGNAVSVHLRNGFKDELKHQKSYGYGHRKIGVSSLKRELLKAALIAPASVMAVYGTRQPRLFLDYPRLKLAYLEGYLT